MMTRGDPLRPYWALATEAERGQCPANLMVGMRFGSCSQQFAGFPFRLRHMASYPEEFGLIIQDLDQERHVDICLTRAAAQGSLLPLPRKLHVPALRMREGDCARGGPFPTRIAKLTAKGKGYLQVGA
jgi:hypothetical protein